MSITIEHVAFKPRCPHCEKELDTIGKTEDGFMEKHVVYVCPHCRKVLSVGYDNYVGL